MIYIILKAWSALKQQQQNISYKQQQQYIYINLAKKVINKRNLATFQQESV